MKHHKHPNDFNHLIINDDVLLTFTVHRLFEV